MCWGSNCRHIINSQNSQQGVGGWDPFDCNLSGNIVFPCSLRFANSASILPAQGGLGDRLVFRMDCLCLQSGLAGSLSPQSAPDLPQTPLLNQPNHQTFTRMVDCSVMVSQGHWRCLEGSGNHLDGECVEGCQGMGVGGVSGAAAAPRRYCDCTKDSLPCVSPYPIRVTTAPALPERIPDNCPLLDSGPPPETDTPAKALPLKIWSVDQQQ